MVIFLNLLFLSIQSFIYHGLKQVVFYLIIAPLWSLTSVSSFSIRSFVWWPWIWSIVFQLERIDPFLLVFRVWLVVEQILKWICIVICVLVFCQFLPHLVVGLRDWFLFGWWAWSSKGLEGVFVLVEALPDLVNPFAGRWVFVLFRWFHRSARRKLFLYKTTNMCILLFGLCFLRTQGIQKSQATSTFAVVALLDTIEVVVRVQAPFLSSAAIYGIVIFQIALLVDHLLGWIRVSHRLWRGNYFAWSVRVDGHVVISLGRLVFLTNLEVLWLLYWGHTVGVQVPGRMVSIIGRHFILLFKHLLLPLRDLGAQVYTDAHVIRLALALQWIQRAPMQRLLHVDFALSKLRRRGHTHRLLMFIYSLNYYRALVIRKYLLIINFVDRGPNKMISRHVLLRNPETLSFILM